MDDGKSSNWDLFAFARIAVPPEATGRYRTVANLFRAVAWVALATAALRVMGGILMLAFAAAFRSMGGPMWAGNEFAQTSYSMMVVWGLLGILFALVIAGVFTVWTGRLLPAWLAKEEGVLAAAQTYGLVVTIVGVVSLFTGFVDLGMGVLGALAFTGLGIAILILLADNDVAAALD